MTVPVDFGGNSYTYFDHQTAFAQTYGMRPEQMAEHYRGLLAGMMGLPLVEPSETFRMGYNLGAAGKAKAEELRAASAEREEAFRKRQSARGKRSAEARKAQHGASQPSTNHNSPNRGSGNLEPWFEPESGVCGDQPQTQTKRKNDVNHGSENARTMVEEISNRGSNRGSGNSEPLRKEGSNRKANAFLNTPCKSDLSVNTARENSETGVVGQICKKRGWQNLSSRPSLEDFLAYAAERWPEWHRDDLERIYGDLSRRGWTAQAGEPIANWQSLLASFRLRVDATHLGERHEMGGFVRGILGDDA